jgi:predicted nucleic acid-binding protein
LRFLDSNIFIYALLKPKRELSEDGKRIKEVSKKIVERIDGGEGVITTIVHLSEVANILEDIAGIDFAAKFIRDVLLKKNVTVESTTVEDYIESTVFAEEWKISVNDALAYLIMKRRSVNEIYSFDKHFEKLDVKIIRE